jgi:hypothetical protein
MQGISGSRTVGRSDSGADNESENGAPDTDKARSQSNDSEQDSTEHPDKESAHSSQYDHTDEESEEWKKILSENESLRKSKKHADRKITELGQDNSRLRNGSPEETSDLESTVESVVARVLKNQSGSNGSDDGESDDDRELATLYAEYGIDDSDKSGDSPRIPKAVLQQLRKVDALEEVLYGMHVEREEDSQLLRIQSELGVPEEAARAMMEKAGTGADVVGLVRAAELTSLPKEARRIARESRQASRASIGHSVTSVSQSSLSDEATLQSEVEDIMKLPSGNERADRVTKLMDDYPESTQMLRSALGI